MKETQFEVLLLILQEDVHRIDAVLRQNTISALLLGIAESTGSKSLRTDDRGFTLFPLFSPDLFIFKKNLAIYCSSEMASRLSTESVTRAAHPVTDRASRLYFWILLIGT